MKKMEVKNKHCYFDSFEDACSFVRKYEEETNSGFVIKKKKKAGVLYVTLCILVILRV